MSRKTYRLLQSGLLIALCAFLLLKLANGSLAWYINQRFWPLTVVAILLLLVMGLVLLRSVWRDDEKEHHQHIHDHEHDHDHGHDHNHAHTASPWGLAFLALPILLGILAPARPLTSSAIESKGLVESMPLSIGNPEDTGLVLPPEERTILDWFRLFYSGRDFSPYLGQQANVLGFVYHDKSLGKDRFKVSRFVVMCCAADAFAIGMVVEWPKAGGFAQDGWVQVTGPVQIQEVEGRQVLVIEATSVESIPQPDTPYLSP